MAQRRGTSVYARRGTRRWAAKRRGKVKRVLSILAVVLALGGGVLLAVFPSVGPVLSRFLGITPVVRVPNAATDSPYAVHIIDVGQGGAALLVADGEYALIDAGPPEAADVLVGYLQAAGVETLRYLFMTHPHSDHIGGMQAVVKNFEITQVVLPNFELCPLPTTSTLENLLGAMLDRDVRAETGETGAVYPLGAAEVRVVHDGLASEDNQNLLSLGLLFEAGGMRFLNTGDAEKVNERAMLASGVRLDCGIMAAGHHGSISTSNTWDFVEAASPAIAVVSCGEGNGYGHPHQGALENFEDVGALALRTDEVGSVVVQPNAEGGLAYSTTAMLDAA